MKKGDEMNKPLERLKRKEKRLKNSVASITKEKHFKEQLDTILEDMEFARKEYESGQ